MLDWCWNVIKRRLEPGDLLFEEGYLHCQVQSKYMPLDTEQECTLPRVEEFPCCVGRCTQVFDTLVRYESHYNSVHWNVCHTCSRIFPSCHLLEIHLLESHDSMFAVLAVKQDMYQCLLEDCRSKFKNTQARKNHMIKVHKFPSNYRYDKMNRKPKAVVEKGKTCDDRKNSSAVSVDKEKVPIAMETEYFGKVSPDKPTSSRVFSYRVPKDICFGQGVSRSFHGNKSRGRGHKSKKKHWHSINKAEMDTLVNIETVDMSQLSEALS